MVVKPNSQKHANGLHHFLLFTGSEFPQDPSVIAATSWNSSSDGKGHINTHKHKAKLHLLQAMRDVFPVQLPHDALKL